MLYDLEQSPYMCTEKWKKKSKLRAASNRHGSFSPLLNPPLTQVHPLRVNHHAFINPTNLRSSDVSTVADASRVNNSSQQCRWPEFWPELQVPAELMAPKAQQRDTAATLNAAVISVLTSRNKACCHGCREKPWRRLDCISWPLHRMMVIVSLRSVCQY